MSWIATALWMLGSTLVQDAGERPEPHEVFGTIRDAEGAAVEGATVRLYRVLEGGLAEGLISFSETEEDGSYRFAALPGPRFPGESIQYRVVVEHPGLALGGGNFVHGYHSRLDIALARPTTVTGQVLAPDGRPVAGARVIPRMLGGFRGGLVLPAEIRRARGVRTDEEGRYALPGMPRGDRLQLLVRASGWAASTEASAIPDSDPAPVPARTLTPGATIRGRLVDELGQPVARVRLFAQSLDAFAASSYDETVTDDEGRWELAHLSPSRWNVCVDLTDDLDGEWTAAALENVEVAAGEVVEAPDLVMTRGIVITFLARNDLDDTPAAGVRIGSYDAARPRSGAAIRSVTTDAEGRAVLCVPPGPVHHYLPGWAPGYVQGRPSPPLPMQAEAGQSYEVVYRLLPGVTVRGRVVDPEGRPVAGCRVTRQDPQRSLSASETLSDAEGGFVLEGSWPGRPIAIGASHGGLGLAAPRILDPADPGEEYEIVLQLQRSPLTALRGRVVNADGLPWPMASVQVRRFLPDGTELGGADQLPIQTDDAGRFEIGDVWPGHRYRVRVSASVVGDDDARRFVHTESVEVSGEEGVLDLGDVVLESDGR